MSRLLTLAVVAIAACSEPNAGQPDLAPAGSGFAGIYTASYTGTFNNTTPFPQAGSNTETGVITVTDESSGQVKLSWQVGANPASGIIIFALTGSTGTSVAGTGTGGACFTGKVSNGNTQTSCCRTCGVTFSGKMLTQSQQGDYTGVTPLNVAYSGTYSGSWTGLRP